MALRRRKQIKEEEEDPPSSTSCKNDRMNGTISDQRSSDSEDRSEAESQITEENGNVTDSATTNNSLTKNSAFTTVDDSSKRTRINNQSFFVAKFIILRLVGFVYLIAFLGALYQNRGLIGSKGLLPAKNYMNQLQKHYENRKFEGFRTHPTLYWFLSSPTLEDWHLDGVAGAGAILSFLVVLGIDSWLIMTMLWVLDFSIVTVASGSSNFYSYGWESQLLETGFLSIWLCDFPSFWISRSNNDAPRPHPKTSPPSLPILWLFRWLCARISLGAGLIKLRGAQCWKNKTCLYYHFETQPIPSPLSFIFHFLPKSMLRRAVDLDYFVQLYSVWMVLLPGWNQYLIYLRRIGGFIQTGFMINIILSGNFAFLNHLTIVPALACLDDDCFPEWLKKYVMHGSSRGMSQPSNQINISNDNKMCKLPGTFRNLVDLGLVALIGTLSLPIVANLLQIGGKHQVMNASFDTFRLVNTYGAFGSVGEARYEPILSLSEDNGRNWTEVEFPCKPGSVNRRPCFCAPYHYRLDWNIWFIGFKPHQSMLQRRERWLYSLIQKILADDVHSERPWMALLDRSTAELLENGPKMKYAKVDMYRYRMADPLWVIIKKQLKEGRDSVIWWEREFEETLIRPVTLDKESGSLAYANF